MTFSCPRRPYSVVDHGWILTAAPVTGAQLSLVRRDAAAQVGAAISIWVEDEAVHAGLGILHPLTDEQWGVRRFFVRDPGGHVANVVGHPSRRDR